MSEETTKGRHMNICGKCDEPINGQEDTVTVGGLLGTGIAHRACVPADYVEPAADATELIVPTDDAGWAAPRREHLSEEEEWAYLLNRLHDQ